MSLSSACGLCGVGLRNLAWASPRVLSSRPASGLDDVTWHCVRELLTCTSGQPAAAWEGEACGTGIPRCHLKSPWYLLQISRDIRNLGCVTLTWSKLWAFGSEGLGTVSFSLVPVVLCTPGPVTCVCSPLGVKPPLSPNWIPITCPRSNGGCQRQNGAMLGYPESNTGGQILPLSL